MHIVLTGNLTRGLYNFRKELIETLLINNDVTIVSHGQDRVDVLQSMGCKFIDIVIDRNGKNPISDLSLITNYKRILKALKPDCVLTYTIKPNIYAGIACASLGIPYISNITGLGTAVENEGVLQKITLPLYKYGLRKSGMVFFQNKENMDFMIKKGVVKGPYDLIPGSGVNLERFSLLEYPHDETVNFVFIGRLIKQKGIDLYIEAAKTIKKKYSNTCFHVCGWCTPEYKDLIEQLDRSGIITYHGQIDDIIGMHKISNCTIHPSYYPEGMSNVLLESCACGRPIITTNRAGCRETVDDGINGFVVKQKDSQNLIEKIEQFLSLSWEEKRRMGLAGRKKVEKEFDRNIIIHKYTEAINQITIRE